MVFVGVAGGLKTVGVGFLCKEWTADNRGYESVYMVTWRVLLYINFVWKGGPER